jgi:rSAM/selenodomain-associated transferase 1
MLQHTLQQALAAGLGPVELCRTPPETAAWARIVLPPALCLSDQGEGDLGARMDRVAARTIGAGESLLLVGTDCPALNVTRLREIGDSLRHADAVMVPATDGGYVALALKRYDKELFTNIAWSTASVGETQAARITGQDWSLTLLPALHDIDEPADLQHLPSGWVRPRA